MGSCRPVAVLSIGGRHDIPGAAADGLQTARHDRRPETLVYTTLPGRHGTSRPHPLPRLPTVRRSVTAGRRRIGRSRADTGPGIGRSRADTGSGIGGSLDDTGPGIRMSRADTGPGIGRSRAERPGGVASDGGPCSTACSPLHLDHICRADAAGP